MGQPSQGNSLKLQKNNKCRCFLLILMFPESVLLICVGDCKIFRTIRKIKKNMSPEIKNLRHFQHIFGTHLCPGQCFPLAYPLGFVQSTFFACFCSTDFVKNLKPITESIPIFKFGTLNDRAECDLVLPWENLFSHFFASAILWDTSLFGAHSTHMFVDTARPEAGVSSTITKT